MAIYQAELVKIKLEREFPQIQVELVRIKTSGDMIRHGGMVPLETKRIYTREIEEAVLARHVDLAVHSAKDMAAVNPPGLKIGAVLEREDPRDCLLSRDHTKLAELPLGARIGTSSLRRKMQLLRRNPELIVEEMHGNVDSRVRKLQEGNYDAIVLAYAGIKRLGLVNYVTEIFPEESFYPAPGQGAIAIQCREHDPEIDETLEPIHNRPSAHRLACERAFLKHLEGGCQLPCGISTHLEHGTIKASGALFAIEGHEWVEDHLEGPEADAEKIGVALAESILNQGGQKILDHIKQQGRHHAP